MVPTESMEKITAERIMEWFTMRPQFANVRKTGGTEAAKDISTENGAAGGTAELESPDRDAARRPSRSSQGDAEFLTNPPSAQLRTIEYPSLPITKSRQKLVSLIENNSVVIVRGATGSGKTTLLPQFILDHYAERDVRCNIVVTQPRKIGAVSIARWVACARGCTLGSLVGYQVSMNNVTTEQTRLIYMTTGVLLQKLITAKSLTIFSHIFIDEVHERTQELDLLLLVVRKLLHTTSCYVKVILMSATINCQEFAEYFGTLVRCHMDPAYVFEVKGAQHPVEEFYLEDVRGLSPQRVEDPQVEYPSISKEMYNVAVSVIQNFDVLEAKDQSSEVEGGASLPERGSVLVFLPGLVEIQYMQEALAKLTHKRLQVYPLHSTVTLEEQNGVFLVPVLGYRKIILSTNIAESSVTVPDVKYVIDFCLVRHLFWDKETNYQSLCLTWASKTNCNQRRGRAGRVSMGYCYRLVTRSFWTTDIPDHVIPEMKRVPLATTVLKVKLLDMGDPRSLLSTAICPPNLVDIERTVLQLKELGALSIDQDEQSCGHFDGELTFLGRIMAHLPVDLHLGKLIVLGHAFGCLEECLIIAACLSLKNFFSIPALQKLTGYRSKLAFTEGVPSDIIACTNAFKAWYTSRSKGTFQHQKDELQWGRENCIQVKRIREVAELFDDLKKRVSQFNMHVSVNAPPSDYESLNRQRFILQIVIAGAFYPNYFSVGDIDEELACRELSGNDPKTTVVLRNLPTYGFLYYNQLQSLFRQCGQVKTISFDSSRAYVEFSQTATLGTRTLPEVSMAILMGQQRHPMNLFVHSTREVESKACGKILSPLRHGRVNADLQSHHIYPAGILSSNISPEQLPPKPMFLVSITEVLEVGHFWGFQADEASLQEQGQLMDNINRRALQPLPMSPHPGVLCLAPFVQGPEEPQYYRVKVLHVHDGVVEVFFVDYGNTSKVSVSSLRDLPADLATQSFKAQEYQVARLRPSAASMITGDPWSSAAHSRFFTLVAGRSHIASLFSILHGVMRVELFVNTETVSASVLDIMVEEGYACRAEECINSKQSHDTLQSLYKDLQNGTFMPSTTTGSWTTRKQEEQELINTLLETFSESSQTSYRCQVSVHGPTSPHLMSFHCMSSPRKFRSVAIAKDSINSAAINEHPEDKHMRILVAGFVSVSSSGSQILVRETSLMPSVPGLPALLCMLFCPVMELQTDSECTSFIGARCGLGWNPHAPEPALSKHDLELDFDVRFTVEDVAEVNALRMAINSLACEGPNGLLRLKPDQIRELQQDVCERLVRLLAKSPPREEMVPHYNEKPKRWSQPTQQIEPLQKTDPSRRAVLFQLHTIPVLNV